MLATRSSGSSPSGRNANWMLWPGLQVRQGRLDRPEGRPASGGVAVEAQGRLGRHAPEQRELILRQRRAQRRDGLRKARFRQRDHVHVAFHDDDLVFVVGGTAAQCALNNTPPL